LKKVVVYSVFVALFLAACAPQSNTVTSKAFHNTTAHFNGYWYAKEDITKIENDNLKSHVDDYNQILLLYPPIDSTRAKGYDKEIQEAIKMASLAIQRHPGSNWEDDSYIMVGKARLLSLDWGNAIQTFKFVNSKSKDPDARHEAIVQLARTFAEHGEYNNAVAAFDYLVKENLNKTNRKNFYLQRAHYYQRRKDYDNMVRNLIEVAPSLKKSDRAGRVYFIIGQVYQKLGLDAEAYRYYKWCVAKNPEYETDFYARLYMAQVAEISRSRDLASSRKIFNRLLKDSKNRDFRDKIYYEMGVFEVKHKNVNEGIEYYTEAIREGANKQIDGEAYLRLGELYYDTLKNYPLSQAYYDSAVKALSPTYENYKAIETRSQVLNKFVENLNTIAWQDSLLVMAKMDTATLHRQVAAVIKSQQKPEVKTKKKKRARVNISEVSSSFNSGSSFESADWYFGNPTAMAMGQTEFNRIWGTFPLSDNWRRSSRRSFASADVTNQPTAIDSSTNATTTATPEKNPAEEAYNRILGELPRTEEAIAASNKKIEEAYFALGDIYYFDLKERDNAIASYETLLKRYPETEHRPETLYKLYLIFKDTDPTKAEGFATELKDKFPESSYAKVLVNPNYLKESGLVVEQQKVLYKSAYENFEAGQYTASANLVKEAHALGETEFNINLDLLSVLLIGKTENISLYQLKLDEFIKQNEGTELARYAQKLLSASRELTLKREKAQGIQYIASFDEPHFFVLISEKKEAAEKTTTKALENFNEANFKTSKLTVSTLIFNDAYTLTLVSELTDKAAATAYAKTFSEKREALTALKNYKLSYFVITKDNFDIFYRTKGLDEYTRFFEKNYPTQTP
jgi:tetratricopeptide (TPR) repeat protein